MRTWDAEWRRCTQRSAVYGRPSRSRSCPAHEEEEPPQHPLSWQEELAERLIQLTPDQFERLAREAPARGRLHPDVRVTGSVGDGGIDGVGVYRVGLLGFHVHWQSKRHRKTVGAPAVRDFRGAMQGRAGIRNSLITTSTFTTDAQAEASRDGAPPIDLI